MFKKEKFKVAPIISQKNEKYSFGNIFYNGRYDEISREIEKYGPLEQLLKEKREFEEYYEKKHKKVIEKILKNELIVYMECKTPIDLVGEKRNKKKRLSCDFDGLYDLCKTNYITGKETNSAMGSLKRVFGLFSHPILLPKETLTFINSVSFVENGVEYPIKVDETTICLFINILLREYEKKEKAA